MDRAAIRAANQRTADRLMTEAKQNARSPYLGKFVGIDNGRVVVVANDWDELARRLLEAVPDPSTTLSLEVGRDYSQVEHIWGLR